MYHFTPTREEIYQKGYDEGYLMGSAEYYIEVARALSDDPLYEVRNFFSEDQLRYLAEVESIIRKYPHYSKKHLAKKVIYEATYLPVFKRRKRP